LFKTRNFQARIVATESNGKLKVSFVKIPGLSLFWGDYWIIGLGEEYEHTILSVPDRKHGWILSRTLSLGQEKLEVIFNILREQGYDPENFEMTRQESIG
jgi:apolipoprotein D and lipocalin family protein